LFALTGNDYAKNTLLTISDSETKESSASEIKRSNIDEMGNITIDAKRDLRFNITDAKIPNIDDERLGDFYKSLLKDLFPSHHEIIIKHYCQQFSYYLGSLIRSTLLKNNFVLQTKRKGDTDQDVNLIYEHEGNVYYKLGVKTDFTICDCTTNQFVTLPPDGYLEAIFQVTDDGFKFLEYKTNSLVMYDLILGEEKGRTLDIQWFEKRNKQNWSWLQRNSRIFEPVFHDSYSAPLIERLKNVYDSCFNDKYPDRSRIAAFMGWPSEGKTIRGKLLRYILTGSFLSVIKNIAKSLTELLPAIVSELLGYGLDKCNLFLSNNDNKNISLKSPLGVIARFCLAHTARAILGVCYLGASTIHQVGMRLTSPIKSAKEAYALGSTLHPVAGVALAALSVTISVALTALALSLFPFLTPSFIKTAAPSLTGSIPYLGTASNTIAAGTNTLATPFHLATESLSNTVAIALPTLPFVWGIKAKLSAAWNTFRYGQQKKKTEQLTQEKTEQLTQKNKTSKTPVHPSGVNTNGIQSLIKEQEAKHPQRDLSFCADAEKDVFYSPLGDSISTEPSPSIIPAASESVSPSSIDNLSSNSFGSGSEKPANDRILDVEEVAQSAISPRMTSMSSS
jgi:hypothetical protein